VGSGRVRKKDTRTAEKVRLVQQLMQEAIDQLEMEGFDVYGDSEREKVLDLVDSED
jgi:predicted oxidoreductase